MDYSYGGDDDLLISARKIDNPIINKALKVRDRVAKNNSKDIHYLLEGIKSFCKSSKNEKEIIRKTLLKIKKDQEWVDTHDKLIKEDHDTPFNINRIFKIIRERNLFEEMKKVLHKEGEFLCKGILRKNPIQHEVVRLKMVLVYMFLVAHNQT